MRLEVDMWIEDWLHYRQTLFTGPEAMDFINNWEYERCEAFLQKWDYRRCGGGHFYVIFRTALQKRKSVAPKLFSSF